MGGTWPVRVIREVNTGSFWSDEKILRLPGGDEAK